MSSLKEQVSNDRKMNQKEKVAAKAGELNEFGSILFKKLTGSTPQDLKVKILKQAPAPKLECNTVEEQVALVKSLMLEYNLLNLIEFPEILLRVLSGTFPDRDDENSPDVHVIRQLHKSIDLQKYPTLDDDVRTALCRVENGKLLELPPEIEKSILNGTISTVQDVKAAFADD